MTAHEREWRLILPRWDVDWQPQFDRRGRPRVDKDGKLRRHRRVWDVLHANARPGHWAPRAEAVREVAAAVRGAAAVVGLDRVRATYATVELVWAPGDHRRADPVNLYPLVKAAVDAIVGLGVLADDSDAYCRQTVRIDRPPARPGLWLEIVARLAEPEPR